MSCDFYQLPRMSFSLPLAVRLKRYGESFFSRGIAPLIFVGRVSGGIFASASQRPTPRRKRMATALDPLRRRAGHHKHREQQSPPKKQPREPRRTSATKKEIWRGLEFSHGTKSGSVHLITAMSWLVYFPFAVRWDALGNKSVRGQDRAFARWMSSLSATHLVRPSILAMASRPTSQPMRWHWAAKAG